MSANINIFSQMMLISSLLKIEKLLSARWDSKFYMHLNNVDVGDLCQSDVLRTYTSGFESPVDIIISILFGDFQGL